MTADGGYEAVRNPQPRWFACCEDCGKAITGEDEGAIRAAIWAHKMDGCDE